MAQPPEENGYTPVPADFMTAMIRINLSAYESRILWFVVRKTFGWHKPTDRISFTQFQEATGIARAHIGRALEHLMARHIIICIGSGYKLEYGIQTDYTLWLESLPKQVTITGTRKRSNFQPRLLPDEVTVTPSLPGGVTNAPSLPKEVTKSLPKEVTLAPARIVTSQEESLPKEDGSLPKEVTKSLPKEVNTKDIKIKTKDNTKDTVAESLLEILTRLQGWFFDKDDDKKWLAEFLEDFPDATRDHLKGCAEFHSSKPAANKGVWKNRFRNWIKHEREWKEKNSAGEKEGGIYGSGKPGSHEGRGSDTHPPGTGGFPFHAITSGPQPDDRDQS